MSVTFYPSRYLETERGTVLSYVEDYDEVEVNVANANGVRILDSLGIPIDPAEGLVGHCDAADFHGRILLALAIIPEDVEIPAYQLQPSEQPDAVRALVGDGGASVWQGPRRAGYLQERLAELAELAEFCQRHGYLVTWA